MKKLVLLGSLSLMAWTSEAYSEKLSKVYSVSKFDGIQTKGAVDLYVTQGQNQSVKITAQKEVMEKLTVEVKGKTLEVSRKSSGLFGIGDSCSGDCGIRVDLVVTNLKKIDTRGATDIEASNLNLNDLKIKVSGAADIELQGRGKSLEIDASGSADIEAFDFQVENAKIEVSGSGEVEVFATKTLESNIKGSGEVVYKGSPATVNSNIAGSGEIKPYKI